MSSTPRGTSTLLAEATRVRLLDEMLGSVRDQAGGAWCVLVMDSVTTKVLSNVAGVSDVMDFGVSLVEDITKRREPLPQLVGIYFISPTDSTVRQLVRDFSMVSMPQYKAAHVFFSSRPSPQQLAAIRECAPLVSRLRTLKEVNLEYLLVDSRTFITAEDNALRTFFGASVDSSGSYRMEIEVMTARLATVFATLREMPAIRFRAAAPPGEEFPPGLESRLLVSQRIAVELHERLAALQRSGLLPERETCELILTDRGFDPVAPVIHEWTYEAMAHDLLDTGTNGQSGGGGGGQHNGLQGGVFTYEVETQGGKVERKEHILDERDALFSDLRHKHFAAASLAISRLMDEFKAKNSRGIKGSSGELDLRNMSKLLQSLPQYRDQLSKLAAHVEIASRLNSAIDAHALTDVGKLEQDLVYGDCTSKEVIALLTANPHIPAVDKVRLLMCYSATHLEKLDGTREAQWQKVARLTPDDMSMVTNLEYLGVPVRKRNKGGGITFGRKRRRAVRKDREPDEDDSAFALTRFVPMLQEVLEDAAAGKLSTDEYPYVSTPASPSGSRPGSMPSSADTTPKAGLSVRSVRTTGGWARKGAGGTPDKAEKDKGRRLFVFIVGGVSYSEMRSVHRLSARLGRDVFLGGTSVETPARFLRHVGELSAPAEHMALEVEGGGGGGGGGGGFFRFS
ncbi:SM Sec1-family [Micractinium conductrix]|uniref:SM Sec1-family n=1 Tax=Micractinium conductrix TaxID=554055 RepID=A0A2P6V3Q4_9CHLO|nr:SM Sec1-family [Micractinium conductrix]|eukprot:PSC68723.1 SM Sec1-family [Micractinium conductrix]